MLNSHCQFVFCSIVVYLLTNRSDKRQLFNLLIRWQIYLFNL